MIQKYPYGDFIVKSFTSSTTQKLDKLSYFQRPELGT